MDPELGIDVQQAIDALQAAGLMPPVIGLQVQGEFERGTEVLVVEALVSASDERQVGAGISQVLADLPHKIVYWDGEGPRAGVDYLPAPD